VRFESVFAPAATTLPTHASLFTGLYPLEHGVVANVGASGRPFVWKPELRTIAQLAKEAGFVTAAFVSAAPLKRHAGLAEGFDVYDQPLAAERKAGRTLEVATRWLEGTRQRPIFLWLHFYDPHRPFDPPPEHAVFSADADLERHLAERRVPEAAFMEGQRYVTREDVDRYDGEIRYVDDRLGELLRALRSHGLYDSSVIVLTADHGEGLNQHDWPGHGGTNAEQLHVPLVIRFPDQERNRIGRIGALVSTVDILPTALPGVDADLARRFAAQASGRDALAEGFQPRPILSRRTVRPGREAAGPLYALTTPDWRLLHELHEGNQLFDRARDPFELDDQAQARPEVVDALRREAAALIGAQTARAERLGTAEPGSAAPLDPELLRQLEALGYTAQ
jgi:arylsulfatase A-like enzyme